MTDPIVVPIHDEQHPEVSVELRYARGTDGTLALIGFTVLPTGGGNLASSSIKDLPFARWDRMARFQAATSSTEDLDGLALRRVKEAWPDLGTHCRGHAKRRWQALVRLARFAEEYARIAATGSSNPAAVLGERHHVPEATVRGWLHRARREGLASASLHPNAVAPRWADAS